MGIFLARIPRSMRKNHRGSRAGEIFCGSRSKSYLLLRIHRGLTISQRGRRAELMWTGIPEKMLPRKHRGAHVDRNFGENVTEEIPFEPPRSSCGQEFPGKYHRGIPFEVRNTVLQARITVGRRGQILNPPRSSVAYFPPRHYFFSTEA